jgi:hypothetical protein
MKVQTRGSPSPGPRVLFGRGPSGTARFSAETSFKKVLDRAYDVLMIGKYSGWCESISNDEFKGAD